MDGATVSQTEKSKGATDTRVAKEARALIAALDHMYGRLALSQNVIQARDRLRKLVEERDPYDESGDPKKWASRGK